MSQLATTLTEVMGSPVLRALVILAAAILAAILARTVLFRIAIRLTGKTGTTVDDQLLRTLRNPFALSLLFGGLAWALAGLELPTNIAFVLLGLIKTMIVLMWVRAGLQVGAIFLTAMSRNHERLDWIQPQTLPILQMVWKVLVIGGFFYFIMISWHINPTSWIASADRR